MSDTPEIILIVDDNPVNRDMLARRLQQEGYQSDFAEDGVIALEKLENNAFDLVLLDIMMPQMNGFEVLEHMQNNPKLYSVPVIVISAIDDIASTVKCLELGAEDYLSKPFNSTILKARISSSLEKNRLRKEEVKQLVELNAMKDQFVGTVSHDLRNPITSILGYSDLLKNILANEDEQTLNFLERIQRNAHHMLDMINDLLDIAKIEAGLEIHPQPVNLTDFLNEQLENYEMSANQKHIELVYAAPETDSVVQIDPNRFKQVIGNLLSNAIKYTPSEGQVRVSALEVIGQVMIEIQDTGLGIPEKDISHLFDKFFRVGNEAHLNEEGTGLGLSIVKAIVEAHHGTIIVDSELGKGSCFQISLPL